MEIDLHAFGIKMRTIRISRGMTQENLAELAALSPHYIGNLEQGIKKPSVETIFRLCSALGTTADQLFQDSFSEDMLKGIPQPVGTEVTFRDTHSAIITLLSDLLPLEEDDDAFLPSRIHPNHSSSLASNSEYHSLTEILLHLFPEADE